jgi:hypothetical protein
VFSREHWLLVRLSESSGLRAGRMVLPFGLRIPDHTQYTREAFGFDKWDQSYALSFDSAQEDWMLSSALFAGDLWLDPAALQERGGVVSAAYNIPAKASLGVSLLGSSTEHQRRLASSLYLRWQALTSVYLLAEVAAQHFWGDAGTQSILAAYVRPGWFIARSLDLYFEFGAHGGLETSPLTKLRYGWGADWQILPWIELAPSVLLEENEESGLRVDWFAQLHLSY